MTIPKILIRGTAVVERTVSVDPLHALQMVREHWLTGLLGPHFSRAYLREGEWYHCYAAAHPDYEWERRGGGTRAATPEEQSIWNGIHALERELKQQAQEPAL